MTGFRPMVRLENPIQIVHKVAGHSGGVRVFEGQIFSGGVGEDRVRVVLQFRAGFKQPATPVGDEFGAGDQLLVWAHRKEITHIQLGAISESFGPYRASPGHDLIQHGGGEPSVNGLFEADVFGTEGEVYLNDIAVGLRAQVKAPEVRFAANEAGARMRQLLHRDAG